MNQIIEMEGQQRLPAAMTPAPATPADIVLYAMQKGADIAQIEKFMDLQMKWEADQARKAFVSDMAEFKKSPPEIVKDKQVAFNGTSYMHATLGNVTEAIVSGLARCGFSHRWDTEQQGGNIVVTCILTHKLGHSERTSLSGTKDDSGKKNSIQQMASTITYLQRYTLLAATGVATKDQEDDDGRAAELDTALADKWITQAKDAATVELLGKVWADGVVEINRARDQNAYNEFKAIVSERKAAFAKAAPAPAAQTAEEIDFARSQA
jgi:hypothetical protein